jgi:DNA-binding transcriptional MerR regulator
MESFSAEAARSISGASQRQLDYWDARGIVPASIRRNKGKGFERRYSFTDLVKLRVVVELRKAGLSLQKIRRSLDVLREEHPGSDALAMKKIITDGSDVFVTTSDPQALKSLLRRGQLAFSIFLLGGVIEEARESIRLYRDKRATA